MYTRLIRNAAIALVLCVGTLQSVMAADPAVIMASDVAAHVGQTATVQGLVASVYVSSKGNAFLNFGAPYPNEVFSGVIFSSSAAQFGDLTKYQGKQVQVTGQIRLYKGKPEIILETLDQLRLAP
jgi:hypothetical protein